MKDNEKEIKWRREPRPPDTRLTCLRGPSFYKKEDKGFRVLEFPLVSFSSNLIH